MAVYYTSIEKLRIHAFLGFVGGNEADGAQFVDHYDVITSNDVRNKIISGRVAKCTWKNGITSGRYCVVELEPLDNVYDMGYVLLVNLIIQYECEGEVEINENDWIAVKNVEAERPSPDQLQLTMVLKERNNTSVILVMTQKKPFSLMKDYKRRKRELSLDGVCVIARQVIKMKEKPTFSKSTGSNTNASTGTSTSISTSSQTSPRQERADVSTDSTQNVGGLVGLVNLRKTCYMSAVLQCLAHIEQVHNFLSQNAVRGTVTKAFQGVVRDLWTRQDYSSFAPTHFKSVMGQAVDRFAGYEEEDSLDFFMALMGQLGIEHDSVGATAVSVGDFFVGVKRTTDRCMTCDHCESEGSSFTHLCLPIPSYDTGNVSIKDCFELSMALMETEKACRECHSETVAGQDFTNITEHIVRN